jgi:hypothetical protein
MAGPLAGAGAAGVLAGKGVLRHVGTPGVLEPRLTRRRGTRRWLWRLYLGS